MSSLAENYKSLIDNLFDNTMSKKIDWSEDWTGELYAFVGGKSIHLSSSRSGDGEPLEVLEIKNGDTVIDTFNDTWLNSFTVDSRFTNYFEKMKFLRITARRQAKGADDAINEVLEALKNNR